MLPPQWIVILPVGSTADTVVVATSWPVADQLIVLVPGNGTAAEKAERKPASTVSATVSVNCAPVAPAGTAGVAVVPTKPVVRLIDALGQTGQAAVAGRRRALPGAAVVHPDGRRQEVELAGGLGAAELTPSRRACRRPRTARGCCPGPRRAPRRDGRLASVSGDRRRTGTQAHLGHTAEELAAVPTGTTGEADDAGAVGVLLHPITPMFWLPAPLATPRKRSALRLERAVQDARVGRRCCRCRS